ncbi:hypothetical protein LCGC14_0938780 [marine sediment metagenome]|uniref:Uncharacterized protein n=1 Tax=marine sediment metagenome TaxID=412755 RepID=A0A0F9NKS9_9ZZZZ
MDERKTEFLEWLLRSRFKDFPFVTYRGGGMQVVVNLQIPMDEIEDYFGVDQVVIRGQVWQKKGERTE